MNLITKVFSDSGVSGVRVLLQMLRGILIIPIITNLLGADSYGVWATVLAFVGLIVSTGGIHLHGSLIRFSASDDEGQAYSDTLFFVMVLATAIMTVLVLFGQAVDLEFLFDDWEFDQTGLVVGSALLIFSNMLMRININFPRSRGRVKLYEVLMIFKTAIETVALILIFFLGGSVITGIFGLAAVGLTVNIFFVVTIVLRFSPPRPRITNFEKYVRYGVPMVPNSIAKRIITNADKYLLLYFISPTAVGIYAVAHSICSSLTKFSSILQPTLYPSVSKAWDQGNLDEIRSLYSLVFRYYSILAIPAFAGISYLAYESMRLLSTPEIADQGAILVPILAFAYLLRGFDTSLVYILTSAKKTTLTAKATIISAAANVVLNVVLITNYGILGAAVATAISHILAFGLIYFYSTRELAFEIPASTFLRSILAAALMLIVLILVSFDLTSVMSLFFYPPLGAAIYFSTLYLIGEFSRDEINDLINSISRS